MEPRSGEGEESERYLRGLSTTGTPIYLRFHPRKGLDLTSQRNYLVLKALKEGITSMLILTGYAMSFPVMNISLSSNEKFQQEYNPIEKVNSLQPTLSLIYTTRSS
nr:hypothetical transcript [Hymenolepis microstoma]